MGCDVGSWGALWEASPKDARGNVAISEAPLENADRCSIRSDGILTAVVGLSDAMVMVVTEDAVSAMHCNHAQDVKKVVDWQVQSGAYLGEDDIVRL